MKIQNRTTHNVIQGSPAWDALRANHFTASAASAMLGVSKYQSRDDLIKQMATGIAPDVSPAQQAAFARGHATEAAIRPHVEQIIGEDLFPATVTVDVDGLPLLASCDGQTMMGDILFEHKLLNQGLVASIEAGELDEHYTVQMEQQLLVTGAEKCLFVCSDGTPDNCHTLWYESNPDLRKRIVAGWKQFKEDLDNYQYVEAKPEAVANSQTTLPTVSVQVSGAIDIADNFKVFEVALRDFIDNHLIREPKTDQDFTDLDEQIKTLKKAEKALDVAETKMLSQVEMVDAFKRTKDSLSDLTRKNRLMAEKLADAKKQSRKVDIQNGGIKALSEHVAALNDQVEGFMPKVTADFVGATKNKRSFDSMQNAVDTVLANAKIEANQIADEIRNNLKTLDDLAADHRFLFNDLQQIVTKPSDDFRMLVEHRINEHKKAEEARLEAERQRIRDEEERKVRENAEAEQRAKDEAERRAEAEQSANDDAEETKRKQINGFSQSTYDNPVQPRTAQTDYEKGYIDGLKAYAHWKDGVQYVGTGGKTLEQAISEFLKEAA